MHIFCSYASIQHFSALVWEKSHSCKFVSQNCTACQRVHTVVENMNTHLLQDILDQYLPNGTCVPSSNLESPSPELDTEYLSPNRPSSIALISAHQKSMSVKKGEKNRTYAMRHVWNGTDKAQDLLQYPPNQNLVKSTARRKQQTNPAYTTVP